MDLLSLIEDPDTWISLLTLTLLEVVLGVDNLVFVSLATQALPPERRVRAARLGLGFAIISRLALLASVFWLIGLTKPVFTLLGNEFSWRDLILIGGGFFLLYKATQEIHEEIDPDEDEIAGLKHARSFVGVIIQIALLDIVFSLDSVLTAMGMAESLVVMSLAVIIAISIMIWASGPIGGFIARHPSVKMLALGFLLLIGTTLVADGFGYHIPKGFIYAAIGFSVLVEGLNQWARRNRRSQRPPK